MAIGSASPIGGWAMPRRRLRALILHAFARKSASTILTVGHFKENPASARVIAKLGFEPSGGLCADCAATGNKKARCLTYRLTRDGRLPLYALAWKRPPLSPAGRGLG